jgi:hypothetical protein
MTTSVEHLFALRAYQLPTHLQSQTPVRAIRTIRLGSAILEVIDEEPAFYRTVVSRLREARALNAPHLDDRRVIDLLVRAANRWMEPHDPFRRLALSVLPGLTGYAPAMIEEGLDHRLAQMTSGRLERLIDAATDRLADRGLALLGPPVVQLVVAGHIPGLAIDELAALLILRSAALVRPSVRDPIIAPLFARTLAELDPRVGELLAVAWWPREAETISVAVAGSVDAVVASGDDATITALSRHAARGDAQGLIGYGHRRSAALIGAESLTEADALAARMARDVCWYEQRGCLSPHVVYVEEGGCLSPRDYAERVAVALNDRARHWPPSSIPVNAASAVIQLRAETEFREADGSAVFLPFGPADRLHGGTVLFDPDSAPRPSPGYRTLWVKPTPRLEEAVEALAPWRGQLESIGLALSDARLNDLRPLIDRLAPSRLAPIGTMQAPPLRWRLLEQGLLLRLAAWTPPRSVTHF